MRVLIIGGDSRIATALANAFASRGEDIVATTRRRDNVAASRPWLDLAALPVSLPRYRADVAFLCAAETSVSRCETQPDSTRMVNVVGLARLAASLVSEGTFVCVPSTTQVFAGTRAGYRPDEPTEPVSEYGRQKAELEQAVLSAAAGKACVVRLGKVVGGDARLFRGWVGRLRRGQRIEAFSDAVMAPVSEELVVELFGRVADARRGGVFHLTARSDITYFDAAREIAGLLGASTQLVDGVPHGLDCIAPLHTALDSSQTQRIFGIEIPEARAALGAASVAVA